MGHLIQASAWARLRGGTPGVCIVAGRFAPTGGAEPPASDRRERIGRRRRGRAVGQAHVIPVHAVGPPGFAGRNHQRFSRRLSEARGSLGGSQTTNEVSWMGPPRFDRQAHHGCARGLPRRAAPRANLGRAHFTPLRFIKWARPDLNWSLYHPKVQGYQTTLRAPKIAAPQGAQGGRIRPGIWCLRTDVREARVRRPERCRVAHLHRGGGRGLCRWLQAPDSTPLEGHWIDA